jgi:uncharacterized protein
MKSKYYQIARELRDKLSKAMPIMDMRVYGSCARGDNSEDSDMDVFIEIETLTKTVKEVIREITWEVGLENEAVISPLIFSKEELENSPLRSAPIIENIMREGIKV